MRELTKGVLASMFGLGLIAAGAIAARPALAQDDLPDGPGKEDLVADCSACHSPDRVLSHRMTVDQWDFTVGTMINAGAKVPDRDKLLAYLATHFGPRVTTPAAVAGAPSAADDASAASADPQEPAPASQTPAPQ